LITEADSMTAKVKNTPDCQSENQPPRKTKKKSENKELGGRQGPEPTRYGDWEKKGRCIDF